MTAYRVDVHVSVPVRDTEVESRVAEAVTALFPKADLEYDDGRITATTHDLSHFRERLFEQRILDTARSVFRSAGAGERIGFRLKKQAARQDVVNFAVGNPDELGDVEVTITVHEPDRETFVDYLAPETVDGKPPEDVE